MNTNVRTCDDGDTDSSSARDKLEPPLRIGVLAACPFPANHGTPGSIRELSEAVAERGHDVRVVTYHFGQNIPLRGVRLHRIKPLTNESTVKVGPTRYRPLYDFQMVFKAIQVVLKYNVDVIHAHGYEAALVAALCRLVTRRPVVYSAHNTMGDELASYNFFRSKRFANALAFVLDRTVPRIGDRCIPHSENIREFLHARGLRRRCEPVVRWGIDLQQASEDAGDSLRKQYGFGRAPIVLYAGVMDNFQRLDLLLDAMGMIVKRHPQAKLVFVVTIDDKQHIQSVRARAERLGISNNMFLTDPQDMQGALRHLSLADVTVVSRPSTPGFPIKLLNYMAAKRPCVMFASSASQVEHGKQVWLVKPDTAQAMADGILTLLNDSALRRQISETAFQFVSTHHDRRRLAESVCDIYVRLLRNSYRRNELSGRGPRKVDSGFLAEETAGRAA